MKPLFSLIGFHGETFFVNAHGERHQALSTPRTREPKMSPMQSRNETQHNTAPVVKTPRPTLPQHLQIN